MNFADPKLVAKHGSWVRVQVAFYDFIFVYGFHMCGRHTNHKLLEECAQGEFSDGGGLYEKAVGKIKESFSTPEAAWEAFLKEEG